MPDEKVVKPKISPDSEPVIQEQSVSVEQDNVPLEKSPIEKEEERTGPPLPNGDYRNSPLFYHVSHYLGLDHNEQSLNARKVSDLIKWAVSFTGSTESGDVLMALKHIERRLPNRGGREPRLVLLYRYTKLLGEREKIDKELSAQEF